MSATAEVHEGLEGIVVTTTMLSEVQGEAGSLVIAGYDVESLAREHVFEDVCGKLFGLAGLSAERIAERIAQGRARAFELLPTFDRALALHDPMLAVRAAVDVLPDSVASDPALIVGAVGFIVATHARASLGKKPSAPTGGDHAADILRIVTDQMDEARARELSTYLVTVCDHGMNASTFAARVVASTGSDVLSCVAAGLAALKGPLHGGAPGPVLDMLDAIGDPAKAEAWLEGEMAAKRRIMGMGHRIYRVRDPRAAVLEGACSRLESAGVATRRLALARAVERVARRVLAAKYPARSVDTNVEFYTAVLLDTLGLPRTHFAALFACGRVAGWLAHIAEQTAKGRLIRPDSLYVGPQPVATAHGQASLQRRAP